MSKEYAPEFVGKPMDQYWLQVGNGQVLARAVFSHGGRNWEYFVVRSQNYGMELIIADHKTYETYGPYEYVLPEFTLEQILQSAVALAAQVLEFNAQ